LIELVGIPTELTNYLINQSPNINNP